MKWLIKTITGRGSNNQSIAAAAAAAGMKPPVREKRQDAAAIVKRRERTPMPPKPYEDLNFQGKHMTDPRFYDQSDLRNFDPEKPHWQDNRFETREKVPFFDLFGFNRDWSWSLFKVACSVLLVVGYMEMRNSFFLAADAKVTSAVGVTAPPSYARDERGTEDELKKAGFAYVGVKELDHLGVVERKMSAKL